MLCVGLLIAFSLSISTYMQIGMEAKLLEIKNSDSIELLTSLFKSVENQYKTQLYFRKKILEERKRKVSDFTMVALRVAKEKFRIYKKSNGSEEEHKNEVLDILRNMRYSGSGGYLWVNSFASPSKILMHPVLEELNKSELNDADYGYPVGKDKKLLDCFVSLCKEKNEGFFEYTWPKLTPTGNREYRKKLSYVRLFRPWNWVIGTGLYIDDLEAEYKKSVAALIKSLKASEKDSDYLEANNWYIFKSSGEMLLHSKVEFVSIDQAIKVLGLNIDKEKILAAVKSSKKPFSFAWKGKYKGKVIKGRSYFKYFEPFDWYVGVDLNVTEIENIVFNFRLRNIKILFVFIFISIFLAYFFAKSIANPLKELSDAAKDIETQGLGDVNVPINGTEEIEALGKCFEKMLISIKEANTEKDILIRNIKESEENLNTTLNSIGDAVIVTDKRGYIVRMNPVAEELTGWAIESAFGEDFFYIIKLQNFITKEELKTSGGIIKNGQINLNEKQHILISKNQSEHFVSTSSSVIKNPTGELMGGIFVFHDMTKEKELEDKLRHSQKMDSIGALAGGIAHDFNNMLGGIIGGAELLRSDITTEEGKDCLDLIFSAAERASDLTKKLLTFSRKTKISAVPFDMNESIDAVIKILRRTIDRKIKIKSFLEADESTIYGDISEFQNLLLNMGINASHAMPDGGQLTFRTKVVTCDEECCELSPFDVRPGKFIEIKITDTGCGIARENLERIFEPFFTTKEKGKGTGLGLASAYGTIKQHHGAIYVYSKVNKGTAFHIYLPLQIEKIEEIEQKVPFKRGSGTILVVDDEPLICTTAKSILELLGYEVITAENGKIGLNKYQEHSKEIDLVILDIIMPEMDGAQCFRALKKLNPEVKVIISSGFAGEVDISSLKKEGIKAFVEKTLSLNRFE